MNMGASKQLSKYLTSPSRIASSLDWKKLSATVLSMNITNKKIKLALASHPSCEHDEVLMKLPDIPLKLETRENKRVVKKEILQELQDLVQKNKVCGLVVEWPVQKETGRMGHDCGITLHTLDSIAADSQILTPNRPFCLWDGKHIVQEQDDEWGRASRYGKQCKKKMHVASKEQYNQGSNVDAVDLWNDFCKNHWPELCIERQMPIHVAGSTHRHLVELPQSLQDSDSGASYAHATLL